MNWKKFLSNLAMAATATALAISSVSACTMIYVGGGLTADGSSYLARSEDYSNSYNKIAYVSQHGVNAKDSVYEGCYGFKHTFSHDSYAYTATRDDNTAEGVGTIGTCPDCGQKHTHTPMEENGTNEMGVSVSAMVTLSWKGNNYFRTVDPMVSGGMCESDMTTILLGEAATAKEGVELLLKIYDTQGAEERSGVLIGDQKEAWYVENYTGHQYIAVKLSPTMIAISPNMGAIGLVDLDDTENVIASKDIIEVAKKAGTYVGDEEANTIDFRASYSNTSINSRMINGLNYLKGEAAFTSANVSSDSFTISNVKEGQVVAMYSPIETNRTLTTKDLVDFYKVDGIGNTGNLEWHIFQISPKGEMETGTIQWLGMENGQYTVAIPYYPVLTTDMYEGYKVGGLGKVSFVAELTDQTGFFPYTNKGTAGFRVLPTGWEKGYYWSVDALSNYALSAACTDADRAMVKSALAVMQDKCYDKAAEMGQQIPQMELAEAKTYATAQSAALAQEAHELTLKLYKHLTTGQHEYVDGVCVCGDVMLAVAEEPQDFAGKVGETAALHVAANKGNVTYQWYYSNNGWGWAKSTMAGADTDTLSVKMTAARVGQQYKCVMTDEAGSSVSSAVVSLTKAASGVKIVSNPVDGVGAVNETVTFAVKVEAESEVSYQWYYSNNGGATWGKSTAPGSTTSQLSIQAAAFRAGQQYKCVVTDAKGIAAESTAAAIVLK